jgi:ADP-heptose:LPS heptosyltransferase
LPALDEISESAEVDLLARSEFADIAPDHVRVQTIERYEIARLFAPGAMADERVVRFFREYAEVYSWHGSRSTEFVGALEERFGEHARVYPFYPDKRGIHQADYFHSCVGDGQPKHLPSIRPRADASAWAADYLRSQGVRSEPVLGLAPGSGALEKNWPVTNFLEVSRWWRHELGGLVLLFLGPAEQKRAELNALRTSAVIAANLPLGRVAALLRAVDVYLGNDSGVTHLAAALGTPTVALFGPSSAAEWGPRGASVSVITHNVECSPCLRSAMKSCAHRNCLLGISAGEVIERFKSPDVVRQLDKGVASDYSLT